jgi:hypothetical protein
VRVLGPRDEDDEGGVGEQLHDAEPRAIPRALTLGDVADEIDRPEPGDEQQRKDVGDRAGAPQPREHERARQQADTPERGLDRRRGAGVGEVPVRLVRLVPHFPRGSRTGEPARCSAR